MTVHAKIHGVVDEVGPDGDWSALLTFGGEEYRADMTPDLPVHAEPGSRFTIHVTKAGEVYLFWPTMRWSKRQLKQARIRARRFVQLFHD